MLDNQGKREVLMMTVDWPLARTASPTLDRLDVNDRAAVKAATVDYLSRWSGGIYGLTSVTVRPYRDAPAGGGWPATGGAVPKWQPVAITGAWYAISCGWCGGPFCACDRPEALRFPFRVDTVDRVTIDGQLFDGWRLDNHRVLCRTDGAGWPAWQRLTLPDSAEGTFAVTLTRGVPVPAGGQIAAAVLAEEIAKAVTGDAACRLPARVQTITRQGVTVGMFDSMDDLADGNTGLWLVDSWLTSVTEAPKVGGIWSPDHDPGRVEYR